MPHRDGMLKGAMQRWNHALVRGDLEDGRLIEAGTQFEVHFRRRNCSWYSC
jgi:hypothetical protein